MLGIAQEKMGMRYEEHDVMVDFEDFVRGPPDSHPPENQPQVVEAAWDSEADDKEVTEPRPGFLIL